jgi:hypothetical protein
VFRFDAVTAADIKASSQPPLSAPLEISFDYTRSLGPVLSQFMTGLANRQILGSRSADGRVHAPPAEYDPVTFGLLLCCLADGTRLPPPRCHARRAHS